MPGDTNMIQVGSLVGLMVMPGEDWQNVKVPGKEASSQAPTTSQQHQPSATTNATSAHSHESHLQMYCLFFICLLFIKLVLFCCTKVHFFGSRNYKFWDFILSR